jgi:hypothetical protein
MLQHACLFRPPPPPVCVNGSTEMVSTSAGELATVGGTTVDIAGLHLGLVSSTVSLTYSGGSLGYKQRSYNGTCVVVEPGTLVRCTTSPGVGANYSFEVTVDGGRSEPSAMTLSYASPIISSVDGPGAVHALAIGGAPIFLRGVCVSFGDRGVAEVAMRLLALLSLHGSLRRTLLQRASVLHTIGGGGMHGHGCVRASSGLCLCLAIVIAMLTCCHAAMLPTVPCCGIVSCCIVHLHARCPTMVIVCAFVHGARLVVQSNFGPADGTTSASAWASPLADSSLTFEGVDCRVVEPHVAIQCITPAGMGAALSWRVAVEGQANALPLSSYAPPTVSDLTFADPGTLYADTAGGTRVLVTGRNFGPGVTHTRVLVSVPAGDLQAENCSLVEVDTVLQCVLPAGTGTVHRVAVTVMGQSASRAVTRLAFLPPNVTAIAPSVMGTDLSQVSLRVSGSGFGSPATAGFVRAWLVGPTPCPASTSSGAGDGGLRLEGVAVSVLTDGSMTFDVRREMDHVVPWWGLAITVSGQNSTVVTLPTRPPQGVVLTFDTAPNGTHYFLLVTGSNFGPGVSSCANDVVVTIDGSPCAGLTMLQVGLTLRAL